MSDVIFWFRRDLRLDDNAGLYHALRMGNVRPLFIFDSKLLKKLQNPSDRRVPFIYDQIQALQKALRSLGTQFEVELGTPEEVFKRLLANSDLAAVVTNHDYEPEARRRDEAIEKLCRAHQVEFRTLKDQVIFERDEVLTDARRNYTVYTPYKKKWLASLSPFYLRSYPTEKYFGGFKKSKSIAAFPTLSALGFERSMVIYPGPDLDREILKHYDETRDYPAIAGTSRLGLHLRFGTLSVRKLATESKKLSPVWLSELIWREFFMQILFHFPQVEKTSFRPEFEKIEWRENQAEFKRWCEGTTGYPLVDAGMRELNATGYMHNRVRMVTASFLTKHLLMHLLLGERYFARQLLDYELASNNGNWQWAAGTGCDAAPYFRVFNPEAQMQRFDAEGEYVKKWVPEWGTPKYPAPMVEHKFARDRALQAFTKALKGKSK